MNLSHRHPRLFTCLLTLGLGALTLSTAAGLPAVAQQTAGQTPGGQQATTVQVTTVKRSAIQVGSSSFALVKGTKLEVLGRDGKMLLVKHRTSQGKIPYADTDYVLSEEEKYEEEVAEAATVPPAPAKPAPPAVKPAPAPAPKATPPPALSLDQIRPATAGTDPVPTAVGNRAPATNYGKAVQKAKQVEQTHKEKLVNPTDEILDEKPKK